VTVHDDRVEQEIVIDAPANFVFRFFIEPERHTAWLGVTAELDPRPGGIYRCVVNDKSTVLGEYLEVHPPERVVFTWGFEGDSAVPPGSSTVSVTLVADGSRTVVRLVHTGLPHPMLAPHDQGWTGYLADLADAVRASGRLDR
jgi:uncharacterized protein YndB with AHSA1/START domain